MLDVSGVGPAPYELEWKDSIDAQEASPEELPASTDKSKDEQREES